MGGEIRIKVDKGEGQEEARDKLIEFINRISKEYTLNYYELLGIIEVVRNDIFESALGEDDE